MERVESHDYTIQQFHDKQSLGFSLFYSCSVFCQKQAEKRDSLRTFCKVDKGTTDDTGSANTTQKQNAEVSNEKVQWKLSPQRKDM
jgi:hypothetical protein